VTWEHVDKVSIDILAIVHGHHHHRDRHRLAICSISVGPASKDWPPLLVTGTMVQDLGVASSSVAGPSASRIVYVHDTPYEPEPSIPFDYGTVSSEDALIIDNGEQRHRPRVLVLEVQARLERLNPVRLSLHPRRIRFAVFTVRG
jgi:hypothetical protein